MRKFSHIGAMLALVLMISACGTASPPDELPPHHSTLTITASQPEGGATGVFLDSKIRITFSEAMDTATAEAAFSVSPAVDCTFSWSQTDTVLTCNPASDLGADTPYVVSLGTGAEAQSGNRLAAAQTLVFTTGATVAPACVFDSTSFGACTFR